jgi:hypothetical protein
MGKFSRMSISYKFKKLRVRLLRLFRKFYTFALPQEKEHITESQKLAIEIFSKVIHMEEAKLLIAPLSSTYYVEYKEIFVILLDRDLKIVNGKYLYDIMLTDAMAKRLSQHFERVLEKRRKRMEEIILYKTKRSLNSILEDINIPS